MCQTPYTDRKMKYKVDWWKKNSLNDFDFSITFLKKPPTKTYDINNEYNKIYLQCIGKRQAVQLLF